MKSCTLGICAFFFAVAFDIADARGSDVVSKADMARARNKVPRVDLKGEGVAHVAHTLNTQLRRMESANEVKLQRCEMMTHAALHELQLMVVELAHGDFQEHYEATSDNRRLMFSGAEELTRKYAQEARSVQVVPSLADTLRDAKCRESVMWYVHHLRAEEKTKLRDDPSFVLPTLPEEEVRPDMTLAHLEESQVIYKAYDDSLQCSTCHSLTFPTNHTWPSDAGVNKVTGERLPSWPDAFSVEFLLEVTTEAGQPGLANISNAPGNTFHYSYNRLNPELSRAVNRHDTCPFYHTMSCNIHHHPDAIYLDLKPGTDESFCCKFRDVAVIPPYWTTWGLYVSTYQKGEDVPGEPQPNWEGFVADRYTFGSAAQLDEHDLHVRAEDPRALVRFHATLPPPNAHSHGYWHVLEDMKVEEQDPSLFVLPAGCLDSCGAAGSAPAPVSSAHTLFPWASIDQESLKYRGSNMPYV
jgi:hypothetical protein